jgi:hypothetical protein
MILGAFASFAQNEWGNTIISCCQLLISLIFATEAFSIIKLNIKNNNLKKFNIFIFALICLSFIIVVIAYFKSNPISIIEVIIIGSVLMLSFLLITTESIMSYNRIRKSKPYFSGFSENYFLFLLFFSAFLKNIYLNGGPAFLFISLLFLIPYITIHSVQFFIKNKNNGIALISLLSIGIFTTALFGTTYLFKFMRSDCDDVLFYISISLTIIMILGTFKWKYRFNNENINVFSALKLLRPNIIYVFFIAAIICTYNYSESLNLMPKFYSQHFPKKIEELNSENKPDLDDKALNAKLAYDEFIRNCEKNGFLK